MGCTCENAYVDMVKTKERFHKKEGVPVSYTHLDVYKRQVMVQVDTFGTGNVCADDCLELCA